MTWIWKPFAELSPDQLYALLKLRSEVFVVEQDCVYLDLDGIDQACDHLLGMDEEGLCAYVRAVPPGVAYPDEASIGRVVTAPRVRTTGLGRPLMIEAIRHVSERWPGSIKIGAQSYLRSYYESLGFAVCGPEYDEDGIPHFPMRRAP